MNYLRRTYEKMYHTYISRDLHDIMQHLLCDKKTLDPHGFMAKDYQD